jgi:hypothetical protein
MGQESEGVLSGVVWESVGVSGGYRGAVWVWMGMEGSGTGIERRNDGRMDHSNGELGGFSGLKGGERNGTIG